MANLIRAVFDETAQVPVISSVVGHFGFREVVPICDRTGHGDSLVGYLVDALHGEGIQVSRQSLISPRGADEQMAAEFCRLIRERSRELVVNLLACLGFRLLLQARDLGLMGGGHVWNATSEGSLPGRSPKPCSAGSWGRSSACWASS